MSYRTYKSYRSYGLVARLLKAYYYPGARTVCNVNRTSTRLED